MAVHHLLVGLFSKERLALSRRASPSRETLWYKSQLGLGLILPAGAVAVSASERVVGTSGRSFSLHFAFVLAAAGFQVCTHRSRIMLPGTKVEEGTEIAQYCSPLAPASFSFRSHVGGAEGSYA